MTEEEYEKALERVSELMDAKPNTPEGDELHELTDRIVEYEKIHYDWP